MVKMVKIKLKNGIKHYEDAIIRIHEGDVIPLPDGWYLKKLLATNKFEIVEEKKKKKVEDEK